MRHAAAIVDPRAPDRGGRDVAGGPIPAAGSRRWLRQRRLRQRLQHGGRSLLESELRLRRPVGGSGLFSAAGLPACLRRSGLLVWWAGPWLRRFYGIVDVCRWAVGLPRPTAWRWGQLLLRPHRAVCLALRRALRWGARGALSRALSRARAVVWWGGATRGCGRSGCRSRARGPSSSPGSSCAGRCDAALVTVEPSAGPPSGGRTRGNGRPTACRGGRGSTAFQGRCRRLLPGRCGGRR